MLAYAGWDEWEREAAASTTRGGRGSAMDRPHWVDELCVNDLTDLLQHGAHGRIPAPETLKLGTGHRS